MPDPPASRDWSESDERSDSEFFAEYLGQATAFEQVQAYKTRSHQLLDLDKGDCVLDAGCGIGDDVLALARSVGPTGEAIGIDNSEALVEQARSKGSDISTVSFRVGDIYDLEFAAGRFDASRADRVLQHLHQPSDAIAELVRVTRPGGRVALTDPDWESLAIDAPGEIPHNVFEPDRLNTRNPAIGRRLYRLCREAGLREIGIDSFLLTTTDFEFAFEMTGAEDALSADSGLDATAVETSIKSLRAADDADRFFGSVPAYTVTGVVPH